LAKSIDLGSRVSDDGHLPNQAALGASNRSFHAYVHVPFCTVRCGYCDFNTYTSSELGSGVSAVNQGDFASVLASEIEFSRSALKLSGIPDRPLASVFFGGGTPTLLPAGDLVSLLTKLRETFGLSEGAEVTSEANPDNLDDAYARDLKHGGFTRISIGMQSADPSVLKTLDRTHDPESVARAVAAAKVAGLAVSVDLIYGAPGESLEQWRHSLEQAIALEPDHISAYSLIVEDGTKLAKQIQRGELAEPDEDLQAEKYELADALLAAAGFEWYELSNWARSSQQRSKHNEAYWLSNDWWGLGPGAHSHVGGVRWWNVKHPAAYTQRLHDGVSPGHSSEVLDERVRLEERILLEIRMVGGLDLEIVKRVNPSYQSVVARAIADELVDAKSALNGRLVLTLRGRLLADALVRDLLG
jgi:oxygen-independent coproporphyrinogen-3 oxidase